MVYVRELVLAQEQRKIALFAVVFLFLFIAPDDEHFPRNESF